MSFASTVLTTVSLDEEELASSRVSDDGCGCCMRDLKKHEIRTLESAIQDMRELADKAEKVLEARKELFEEIGMSLSRETKKSVIPECVNCGKSYNPYFDTGFYVVDGDYLCKSCVENDENLYRDKGVILSSKVKN